MTTAPRLPLGILVLDTRFPRIRGDIGNAESFGFPVVFETMHGFGPRDAVFGDDDGADLPAALRAATERLLARGVCGLSTSCGFLVRYQAALARLVPVPVVTSSLLQVAGVAACLPAGKRVGIITASAEALGPRHLQAAGVPAGTVVAGMPPKGAFAATFLENGAGLDAPAVEAELVAVGRKLRAEHPDMAAIVLECTNLPPYRTALQEAVKCPVEDMQTYLHARFA